MMINLSKIDANPFRDMGNYELDPARITKLVESFKKTGFWDNVVVRKHPDKKGRFQLAYGHHRFAALKKARFSEATFVVKDLGDVQMFHAMVDENATEFSHNPWVDYEAVAQAVHGFGAGFWKFKDVPGNAKKTDLRNASSDTPFARGARGRATSCSYVSDSVAKFLGWGEKTKAANILMGLEAIDLGLVTEKQIITIGGKKAAEAHVRSAMQRYEADLKESKRLDAEANELARHAENRHSKAVAVEKKLRAKKLNSEAKAKAKKLAEKNAKDLKSGKRGYREVATEQPSRSEARSPVLDKYVGKTLVMLTQMLEKGPWKRRLVRIFEAQEHLESADRRSLVQRLRTVAKRFTQLADSLEAAEGTSRTTIPASLK